LDAIVLRERGGTYKRPRQGPRGKRTYGPTGGRLIAGGLFSRGPVGKGEEGRVPIRRGRKESHTSTQYIKARRQGDR